MVNAKTSIKTRLISLLLTVITILGVLPLNALPAFASSGSASMVNNEITNTAVMVKKNGHYIIDRTKLSNYTTKISGSYWGCENSYQPWMLEPIDDLIDQGVLLGIQNGDKYIIPTYIGNSIRESEDNGLISGKEALALSLFYFYGSTNSEGFISYNNKSRQNVYQNASSYYNNANGLNSYSVGTGKYNKPNNMPHSVISGAANQPTISRGDVFLMIALAAEQESGGAIHLSDYSAQKFGAMADNKTKIKNYDYDTNKFSGSIPCDDIKRAEGEYGGTVEMQAANMLVDVGAMTGRSMTKGANELAFDGDITYGEFYAMLFRVKKNGHKWRPTEYSQIEAALTVDAGTTKISYRDILDGDDARIKVTLNASKSYSRKSVKSYALSVEDDQGNDDSNTGTSASKTFNFNYSARDLGFDWNTAKRYGGEKEYDIDYTGNVIVTDTLGATGTAKAEDTGTIRIVNYAPTANYTATTDGLPSDYAWKYFYVGKPITVIDGCNDYENALVDWYYTVKRNGSIVAATTATANAGNRPNFNNVSLLSKYVSKFDGNGTSKQTLTFAEAGTYTLEAYCVDEMGKKSNVYQQTLIVTPSPAPPTAKIVGNDYTYMNFDTTFTDASFDPNDDIVKWEWTPVIMWFDEIMDENGDGTGEGTWVVAQQGVHYAGTMNNQTRKADGSYTTASGTLQFKKYGKFRIYLTVTDATNLTDTAYHEITVLESIPVIDVDNPDPGQTEVKYTVTFINSDGTITKTEVPAGSHVSSDKVPQIVDVTGVYEHGWTQDGNKLVEPTDVVVNGNLTFVVLTTPEDDNKNLHTVTFINTDGTRTTYKVPHGGKVPASDVPTIVDAEKLKELGWTNNGYDVVTPSTITINRDMLFWVQTEPEKEIKHKITFVNTDGTTTTIEVKDGDKIPADKIPGIIDLPDLIENGWTSDNGTTITDSSTITPTHDMVFTVDTDPVTPKVTHTVTFINSDGSVTIVVVNDGEKVSPNEVPKITDIPEYTENGWTKDGATIIDPTTVVVKTDLVFWVDKDKTSHKVTFINTDGTTTTITVEDGKKVPASKVPDIIDMPGKTENGWTTDGSTVVDPTKNPVTKDIIYRVSTTPEEAKTIYTVTFINTDGTVTKVQVPAGEKVPSDKVPNIVDKMWVDEKGWTLDGTTTVDPTKNPVTSDITYRVLTESTSPLPSTTHTVTFVNTDGTVTTVKVKDGEKVPADKVPGIVDILNKIEKGWTENGTDLVNPSDITIKGDKTFYVKTEPVKTHKVTFINTDGTKETIEVPDGATVPANKIPTIFDDPEKIENGWTSDGKTVVDPSKVPVTDDIIYWVDTDPYPTHNVTFINTDGSITTVRVPDGQKVPASKVPGIIDIEGIIENGWTKDGSNIIDPTTVVVKSDLVFWVDKTANTVDKTHKVTFINTDGSTTTIRVPHGGHVPASSVPNIIDDPDKIENGWTNDGVKTVTPTDVVINGDMVFWVDWDKKDPTPSDIPYFDDYGRLIIKQNRAGVIDATKSLSPPDDPIQVDKTEWELISVDGYDLNNVKFQGGKASGLKSIFVAKEAGTFKIKVTLHNNYSDTLAEDKPNSSKLNARTKTITVVVYPDEPPTVDLFVNNANPNFHTNPTSTNVTVASSAASPDGDILDKYSWKITRDDNNDGNFEEKPFYTKDGDSSLSTATFPVEFKSGVVGKFLAQLTVTEKPGQTTLPEFVSDEDNLSATTEKQFEVNWTPCISYDFKLNNNEWAYVDDVIDIAAKVLDENTSTCHVDWTLKKKVGESYVKVDSASLPVWDFGTLGGRIQIPEDGYYVLEAIITDDHGYTETFVSNEIRIYDLPQAVISDDADYRWQNVQWQYKQARRFDLDGNASYADDKTGPALHQIDHEFDTWTITPMGDGASADAIYVLNDDGKTRLMSEENTFFCATKNAFDEQIAIIEPGTYLVTYQVTNTYGKKSPVVTQMITVVEDIVPEISIGTPEKEVYLGSAENDRNVTIGMTKVTVKSTDADIVGTQANFVSQYRYDSDNDGDYEDEEWKDCDIRYTANKQSTTLELSMTATVRQVGWYQFRLQTKEGFGQPTLETIIPEDCYIRYEYLHEVHVLNTAPQGTFDVASKVYGDIVFAMGTSKDTTEVSEKTLNFSNGFGSVPGAEMFQLNVQTVKTGGFNAKDADANSIYQFWDQFPNPNNYTLQNGTIVNAVYNWNGYAASSRPGSNSKFNQVFIEGNSWEAKDFELSTTYAWHGCGWSSGFIFHWDKATDTAYKVDAGVNNNLTLKKVQRVSSYLGAETHYDAIGTTLVSTNKVNIPSSGDGIPLTIAMKGNRITISTGDAVLIDYTDPDPIVAGGIGLWAGCTVHYKDISLTYGERKTLVDALSDTSFDSSHDAFVIWTEDSIPPELDKTSETYEKDFADLLSMVVSSNIHLIILGSSENKDVMEALLDQCIVPGTFIDTGTVDGDLTASRDFIVSILRKATSANVKYVLINEETVYNKHYTDFNGHDHWYAGGGTTDTILSSKWWYSHDPNYYCNQLGLLNENEVWRPNEITMFSQTGHYYVNYKVKDNSVPDAYLSDNSTDNPFHEYRLWSTNYDNTDAANPYAEIFVHRRPLAEFDFKAHMTDTAELTGIDITNMAYDLDHYEVGNPKSRADKGLQMYEWTYQSANDASTKKTRLFTDAKLAEQWINQQLAAIHYDSNTNVLVSYRVRDIDGVEVKEKATYTYKMSGTIYKAPTNSYHHTKLDEDLVVNGKVVAKAGTYVTNSYTEAISELRAAADKRMKEYQSAKSDYESKNATATQLEQTAAASEAAAKTAEANRDAKQTQINNQQSTLNSLNLTLNSEQSKLITAKTNLTAAQSKASDAKSAYDTANSRYQALVSECNTISSEITSLKSEVTALTNELNALKAKDTSAMTDEELAAHNKSIADKQSDITVKNAEITTKTTELTAKQSERDAAKADADAKNSAYQTAKADVTAKQKAVTAQQAKVDTAKQNVDNASASLNTLKTELANLTKIATDARTKANQDRANATNARNTANQAKSKMDNAKAAWDAAEAAVAAVKPLSTNSTIWATKTDTLTIPDGVWSNYNTVRISGNPIAPVAKFKTNKIYYDIKEDVTITDQSYSPNGNDIVVWDWTVTNESKKLERHVSYSKTGKAGTTTVADVSKMEELISKYVTDLVNSQKLGLTDEENTYKITLSVTDNKSVPMTSERSYSVSITIRPSNNPPTIDPTDPGNTNDSSIYRKDGVLVYEYDDYDADKANPFYTYKGAAQKRGTETLDWTVVLDDPDNHDKYGTANDSDKYILDYVVERFMHKTITTVTDDVTTQDTYEYGPKTLTAKDALDNSKVAPFVTSKDGNLKWGAYRITTTATDVPNNGTTGKSASIKTHPDKTPKHLYVIPRLEVDDIHFTWEGETDTTEQVPVGDTVTVTFTTNAQSTGANVVLPDGEGGNKTYAATFVKSLDDGTKLWTADVNIPDTLEEDDLVDGKGYTFYAEATTTYGKSDGTITRNKLLAKKMNVLAIKLYNFHLTDISDPSVKYDHSNVFVKDLAFDENNTTNSSVMKKGYSFYFKLSSMGLKNANDTVRIRPSFFGYNQATGKYAIPLDVYYKNKNDRYVLGTYDAGTATIADDTFRMYKNGQTGSELGTMRELILDDNDRTLNGKEQIWTGRYGLPNTAVFVAKNASLTENNLYKGHVLISFQIEALKNGTPKYDYTGRGQWAAERLNASGMLANPAKAIYNDGSIIVIDGNKNALDNYTPLPVWRKSN